MKTYKNFYPQIYTFENLYRAYRAARKGKRDRAAVAAFEFDMEGNLLCLQRELREQTYRPGEYTNFYIHQPKRRLVSAARENSRPVPGWAAGAVRDRPERFNQRCCGLAKPSPVAPPCVVGARRRQRVIRRSGRGQPEKNGRNEG